MAAKQFTLTNTGTSNLVIQSVTFNGPSGVGHTANLSNLGGSSTETGNAVLSYNIVPSAVQTFTVDYYDAGVGIGTYTGNIVIGCSNSVIQTIASTVVISAITTSTTTTAAPTTTTTTTSSPGTTTTTTSGPTTTSTTSTTTRAPTTTTTTTSGPTTTSTTSTTTRAPTTTTTTTSGPTTTSTTSTTTSGPTTTSTTSTTTSGPTTTSTTSTTTSTTSTTTSAPTTTSTTSTTTSAPTTTSTTSTTTSAPTTTTTTLAPTTTTTTSGGGPVSPLGFNGKNYTYSGQSAQLTLAIYSDGTWQLIPTNSGPTPTTYNDLTSWTTITGNWYSPTTLGIGSGYIYWIQVNSQTQVNDGIVGTSLPTSTWVPFPVTSEDVAYVSITAAGGDDAEGSFTFKVGQNIITPVILSTSTFTLHGYSGASPATTTTTTTAAPGLTTTTTTSAPTPPVINSFFWTPTTILANGVDTATLSWNTSGGYPNSVDILISSEIAPITGQPAIGTYVVGPYTGSSIVTGDITVTGPGGTTSAPPINLTVTNATTTTTTLAPTTTTTTTSGGGPVSPLGFNGKNYTYSGQSAQLTLAIYADGTWQLIPTNSGPTPTTYNDLTSWNTITGNWYSPTTPGIGSGYIYWIQVNSQTQVNDGLVGTSIPANEWVPFPATSETVAYVSISAAGGDDAEGNFTFKVGQNIITPVILSTSTFTLHGYST